MATAFKPVDTGYRSHDAAHGFPADSETWTPSATLTPAGTDGLRVYNSFGFAYVWGKRNIDIRDASRALEVSFDSGNLLETMHDWGVVRDVWDQVDGSLPAPTKLGVVTYRASSVTVVGECYHDGSGWHFT